MDPEVKMVKLDAVLEYLNERAMWYSDCSKEYGDSSKRGEGYWKMSQAVGLAADRLKEMADKGALE